MEQLVSVCIPAYNNAEYIGDTIKSILAQTYTNFELVVIDDQSKDNTLEVVEGFEDNRIRILRNEKNLGMSGNWNKCINEAKGEFIKLICADDTIHPNCLEKEVEVLNNNPEVNLVMSDTQLMDQTGKVRGAFKRYYKKGTMSGKKLSKISLMINNFFGAPCNNMFRAKIAKELKGFDTSFTYILDFDMWVRLACTGEVYIIHEFLNCFRMRDDSNTGDMIYKNRKIYVAEHRKLVEKHASLGIIKINKFEVWLSVQIRKFRNIAINIYMKIHTR